MAHKSKEQIKAYYQTNFIEVEDLAKIFKIPKRTLYQWIKKEGWVSGAALPNNPISANDLIKDEFASRLTKAKDNIQEDIKNNLINQGISEIIATASAKKASDNLLLKAMSLEFLDSKATESLLIGKNAFERFVSTNINHPSAQQKIITMAKNMVEMYSQVKSTIYGKSPEVSVQIANINPANESEFKNLSDKELLELIHKSSSENST
ncbi:hypothetical protein [Helicobacter sp. 13S00477-4]|uniref:hypothetical protein n=1 Tax=Helicobacter sp. 13S00477-4 TaxID=1905759 RepID=UPI000BA5213D|nr:hypothetical protein [Helicobacter sp. 13S00477-4]PAF51974.1 hypothetical protein BKH44_04760 [Helicobacter sp. 13S00477-4]